MVCCSHITTDTQEILLMMNAGTVKLKNIDKS